MIVLVGKLQEAKVVTLLMQVEICCELYWGREKEVVSVRGKLSECDSDSAVV